MHRLLLGMVLAAWPAAAMAVDMPAPADPRLVVELFAAEPDLVTPTGIAVDARGRVLVIESHTHFRPPDYQGPPADRIRVMQDTDGDGRADRIGTFFEGSSSTMNLAVHHDGSVYVATRYEVFRLRDGDGDGQADQRDSIARLETPGDYPHNGLSGFAFDFSGNVYFGLGENLGAAYRLIGSDGIELTGGGEGGSIYRTAADGSGLVRVATGFWNPFHLAIDRYGRLFAVDNDPDSRPPCRLLHIVADGDYGYRFRNGRKGLHPFTAWDGELPGTLGMVSGTGEAPSGIVAYESDGLPGDYRGNLLCTSWGDHRLERYALVPRGASFESRTESFVTGGEDFRPVGIAVAPDGSLFVSDWVDKSYTLHGKGRIWRIRRADAAPVVRPTEPAEAVLSPHRELGEAAARQLAAGGGHGIKLLRSLAGESNSPALRARAVMALAASQDHKWLAGRLPGLLRAGGQGDTGAPHSSALAALVVQSIDAQHCDPVALAASSSPPDVRAAALRLAKDKSMMDLVLAGLSDEDPFVRQAALFGLARSASPQELLHYAHSTDSAVRLGAALALRQIDDDSARSAIAGLFEDPDPSVLFVAVQWVGESHLGQHRRLVESLLQTAGTRQLFEACLAALALLDRKASAGAPATPPDEERAGEEYVAALLADGGLPATIRSRALRMLRPDHPSLTLPRLAQLLESEQLQTQLEAVRTLRESPLAGAPSLLAQVAADPQRDPAVAAEAAAGLSPSNEDHEAVLIELLGADEALLVEQALRSLTGARLDPGQRQVVGQAAARTDHAQLLAARVLTPDAPASQPVAASLQEWLQKLDGPADPGAGERIFFQTALAGCSRCHQVDGRGERLGPDLSGRQLDRAKLVDSILHPSKEIAPRFVTWSITKTDGTAAIGMLVEKSADGSETYADAEGRTFVLQADQIDERQPQQLSIMPDNVAARLTLRELADLAAYLLQPR